MNTDSALSKDISPRNLKSIIEMQKEALDKQKKMILEIKERLNLLLDKRDVVPPVTQTQSSMNTPKPHNDFVCDMEDITSYIRLNNNDINDIYEHLSEII